MRYVFFGISFCLTVAISVSLFATTAFASPSLTINYQGKLTTPAGVAVANGAYTMEFRLYTTATGGSAIWTETRTGGNQVTVQNGLFSVMLGSVTSLSAVNFNQPLYLGVNIASDGEMTPRKILGTVPSAFEARQLGGVASTSFLRSDQADSASGLLSFTGGLISSASSTINRLSFTNATGTSLFIGGDRITDFTGSNLSVSGGVLNLSSAYTGQTSITTLGTITTGTWNGGVIGSAFLDTAAILATEIDTSAELRTILTDETGTGLSVFNTNPTLTGNAITLSSLTASRALFLGAGSQATTTALSASLINSLTDETGTGVAVFATSPTLVTPNLGTPSALTLTNATGLPISTGVTGLGTNVATALGINVGTAGSLITNGGALGTPTSGTLTNATGLPIIAGTTGTLTETRGGTNQTTYTTGDFLFASAANTLSKRAIGTAGQVMQVVGGVPTWVATSTLGLGASGATVSSVGLAAPTGFTVSNSPVTTSGTLTLSYAAGFEGLRTASSTNWNSFFNTPSTRITAGTGLAWSANTLNCVTATGSTQGCITGADWTTFNNRLATSSLNTSAKVATIVGDETGTGALVFGTNPVFTTPNLGTPSTLVLTNATGLPISTGVSGLAAGAAAFLATPSSANLATLMTDETGTGALVFAGSPTFTGTINVAAATFSSNLTLSGSAANIVLGNNFLSGDGGDEGVFVSSTGNVGIGTTTTPERLTVQGNIRGDRFIGFGAGGITTNSAVGASSLNNNTTGTANTATGRGALLSNTSGSSNTATGNSALQTNTIGSNNVANGSAALFSNTEGNFNTALGTGALFNNLIGSDNTATGNSALTNSTGASNSAFGRSSLSNLTTGSSNTALGANTGLGITTGSNNTILGANVSGLAAALSNNIIIADGAGNRRINVDSTGRVGIGTTTASQLLSVGATLGSQFLVSSTGVISDGTWNGDVITDAFLSDTLTIGAGSTFANNIITPSSILSTGQTDEFCLTYEGTGATWEWQACGGGGLAPTDIDTSAELRTILTDETGTGRSVFSVSPAFSGTPTFAALTATSTVTLSGSAANIVLGNNFLSGDGGDEGVFVSSTGNVGIGTTTPSERLVVTGNIRGDRFIGYGAGGMESNSAVGLDSLLSNTTGQANTAIGASSLYLNTTGTYNTAIGAGALLLNTTGSNNSAVGGEALGFNTSGSENIAIGIQSLYSNTTGSSSTAVGASSLADLISGNKNTAIGINTGRGITTGSNNTILGANVTGLAAALSNNIIIADGNGNRRINVDSTGRVGIGTTTPSQLLSVGATLTNQFLVSSTGVISDGTWNGDIITDAFINDAVTVTGGTLGSNNISSASTWTTLGQLTVGDGGDRVDFATSGWDVVNSVFTNVTSYNGLVITANTGVVTTGTWSATALVDSAVNDAITVSGGTLGSNSISSAAVFTTLGTWTLGDGGDNIVVNSNTWDISGAGAATGLTGITTTGTLSAAVSTFSGDMTLSGTSANIILGSNYLSGDGGDEGVFVSSTGNVGIGTITTPERLTVQGNIQGNRFIGYGAGGSTLNSAVGLGALAANTTGVGNTADGSGALGANTTGGLNTAVGNDALRINLGGTSNTALGYGTLYFNVSGSGNTATGDGALFNSTGSNNTATGNAALTNITTGANNTAFGWNTGLGITTGSNNTILGANVSGLAAGLANNIIIADGAGNQRINVGSTGNVGIGTTTPGANFAVAGNAYLTGNLILGGSLIGNNKITPNNILTTGQTDEFCLTYETTGAAFEWQSCGAGGGLLTDGGANTYVTATGDNFSIGGTGGSSKLNVFGNIEGTRIIAYGAGGITSNLALGGSSLNANTTGLNNTAVGSGVLAANTTGANNTAVGASALGSNITGQFNIGIGTQSLFTSTSSVANTAVGYRTLINNTRGNSNVALGNNAMLANTTGSSNTALGDNALTGNISGGFNVALGSFALSVNTTGSSNMAIGTNALGSNTTGRQNVAIGNDALISNVNSSQNVAIGFESLFNSTGASSTAIGAGSLFSNTTGVGNSALGWDAISDNTTGSFNTALGFNTGLGITTGSNNTILGANVTGLLSSLSNNIIIADGAGNQRINVGSTGNVGIGTTTPSAKLSVVGNILGDRFIGYGSGGFTTNSAVGANSLILNNTGTYNTATGVDAIRNNFNGSYNTATGVGAIGNNFNGSYNTATGVDALRNNFDGVYNTATGYQSLYSNTNGGYNTANGIFSLYEVTTGSYNTAFGNNTGRGITTGNNNTILGANVTGLAAGLSNNIIIADGSGNQRINVNNVGDVSVAGNFNVNKNNAGFSQMGTRILYASSTNTSIGVGAGAGEFFSSVTTNNVALGTNAGRYASTTFADDTVYLGTNAGYYNDDIANIFVGTDAGYKNRGYSNIMIGRSAGYFNSDTGNNNTMIGDYAGQNNTGTANIIIGTTAGENLTGSNNVTMGFDSARFMSGGSSVIMGIESMKGVSNYTASNNTTLGFRSGFAAATGANNNILLGYQAADNLTTGNNNIIIGYDIDSPTATVDNILNIGNVIFGTGIDASGTTIDVNANIGIGTSTPSARLSTLLTDTNTTAGQIFGNYNQVTDTGVVTTGTDTTYGSYRGVTRTGATGGTFNTYGDRMLVTGNSPSGTPTINNFGSFIEVVGTTVGTSVNTGLTVSATGADTNYAAVFTAGNVGVGDATPLGLFTVGTADAFQINASGVVTNGTWSATALVDSAVADAISVAGGTIGSNNISAASTWTTLGQLTVGDGGDRVDFNTSGWDVINSVFTGVTSYNGLVITANTGVVTIGTWSATALVDSAVNDAITVSGGTLGSNNISSAATFTTLGTWTLGDGGDAIVINSSLFDISSAGRIDADPTNNSSVYGIDVLSSGTLANNKIARFGVTGTSNGFTVEQDAGSVMKYTFENGNVGIGITSPSAQLHTTGSVRFATFGAGTLITDASGNVSVSSDERLKDIEGTYTNGLAAINGLQPITYKWNALSGLEQQESYLGFSAQNVQAFIPEAVDVDNRGFLTLSDRGILAALVNATKELSSMSNQQAAFASALATSTSETANTLNTTRTYIDAIQQTLTRGLSEQYFTDDTTLSAGELVALDTQNNNTIVRADANNTLFGVIATQAGISFGTVSQNTKPVAFVGRVPVKVNMDGGEIAIGDAITLSSTPGIGTKATTSNMVVGTALEEATEDGVIQVSIAPRFAYIASDQATLATLFGTPENAVDTNDTFISRLKTLADNFVAGVLQVAGVKTDELCVGEVCVDEATFLQMVENVANPVVPPEIPNQEPPIEDPAGGAPPDSELPVEDTPPSG